MLTVDRKVQDFCQKYEATIQTSHKKWRRYKPIQYQANDPCLPINHEMVYDEVPMVELTIPADRLSTLIDLEDFKDRLQKNLMSPVHSSGTAYHMLTEYEEECRIRHTNPTVQKAYEQYRMLLNLVR